jgi:hypothetical protein
VGPCADHEARIVLHVTVGLQVVNLVLKSSRVQYYTISYDAVLILAQNPGRHEVKDNFLIADNDSVARVRTPLKSHNDIGEFAEDVYYLAFAFVTPLKANGHNIRH